MDPDKADEFTEQEFVAAFLIVADPVDACRFAREVKEPRGADDSGAPWQLAPDVLDLLSLVSEDCAKRVARILDLSPDEALNRRRTVAERFGMRIDD